MSGSKRIAKRKRATDSSEQPRLRQQASGRAAVRNNRSITRSAARLGLRDEEEDEEEEEELAGEEEEAAEEAAEDDETVVAAASPPPPKSIDGKKLPVLLSLFCGSRPVTGETMFTLEQLSSLDDVRSRLGRHFFWEMKRAGVPADLNFIRVNCMAPDGDGPVRGAWPLATAEAYKDWVDQVMGRDGTSGQFARVQVVGLTNHQLAADGQTYRDWFGMDLNPVPYWFAPLVEDMDGVKWMWDQEGMGEPVDGREWN